MFLSGLRFLTMLYGKRIQQREIELVVIWKRLGVFKKEVPMGVPITGLK